MPGDQGVTAVEENRNQLFAWAETVLGEEHTGEQDWTLIRRLALSNGVYENTDYAAQLLCLSAVHGDLESLVYLDGLKPEILSWKIYSKSIAAHEERLFGTRTFREQNRQAWIDIGGEELEEPIRSGAIALLDAVWLVDYAASNETMVHRQKLPKEAFLTCEQLIASTDKKGFPIVALSYMWLTPDHPDPKGDTLRLLAKELEIRIKDGMPSTPRLGVFWDYASLHQHPRSAEQKKLFEQGLGSLAMLFSCHWTSVYRVTVFPPGYPGDYKIFGGTKMTGYNQRGWPFTESCWATMTKESSRTVDIFYDGSKQTHTERGAPVLPERFEVIVQNRVFTNQKDDRPLVIRLYREYFVRHFSHVDKLNYCNLQWLDEQVSSLAELLLAGYASAVEEIDLGSNSIGEAGCRALVKALDRIRLKRSLRLSFNPLGDDGAKCFANAIGSTRSVDFTRVGLTHIGCRAIVLGVRKHPSSNLLRLHLGLNRGIGDEGCRVLAPILARLEEFDLHGCNVGDSGCEAIATAICRTKQTILKEFCLRDNPITDEAGDVLCGLVSHCSATLKSAAMSRTSLSTETQNRLVDLGGEGTVFLF